VIPIPPGSGAFESLGIPPLAGIASYEEAARPGLDVDESVARLRRLEFIFRRLHLLSARSLPTVPEWEAKCGLGLHAWLDAEACGAVRARIGELRNPPPRFDDSPDEGLTTLLDELGEAETTVELLCGLELVRADLLAAIDEYLGRANPLADFPTVFLLRRLRGEQAGVLDWTRAAAAGLAGHYGEEAADWTARIRWLVESPGEVDFELRSARPARSEDVTPRRDRRFTDAFNTSAKIDGYYTDTTRPADERAFALVYKRLREMDVPEWMGPILSSNRAQPWAYHTDLARQLWDETRHAMMGEVVLHSHGVPHYAFPVPINAVEALNSEFDPREAHLLLWGIEQSLMPADTGKRFEFEIVRDYGDPLIATFQDFDWADEVVHVKIGRRWIASEYASTNEARLAADDVWARWDRVATELEARSDQKEWWPAFVELMRAGTPRGPG
jgi:hypothetical protein